MSHLEAQHTDIGQMQDHTVVPCVFSEEEKNDYKISVLEMDVELVFRLIFSYFPYKSKLLNQHSVTTWEEEHLLNKYCTL
jgi:hypothetical protein